MIATWPRAYDQVRVAVGFEHWSEQAAKLEDAEKRQEIVDFAADSDGSALLTCIFGNSPYLSRTALREQIFTARLLSAAPDEIHAEIGGDLRKSTENATDKTGLMRDLRIAKGRIALLTAVADIAGWWPLPKVTGALTELADTALRAGVDFLLRDGAARGELGSIDPAEPSKGSGLAVFALGKHGAGELNYSSDIDIMVLFDQEVIDYRGSKDPTAFYVRLTRTLVEIMQERTRDGYVFRTDLRLRPDPGSSPLALSMAAAEAYYESLGQNWERAAMIKARAAAGDREAGDGFLSRLAPFIWRKYLDYAAIEDIHSIKRQIHTHRGHASVVVPGHNIKVGRGGIREIEFFAQTQQLIAGGRDTSLRVPATCQAIRALSETERLSPDVADNLIDSYEFLRRLEHRLQMIDDEQTHSLPKTDEGLDWIAAFMGFEDRPAFEKHVLAVLNSVQSHYGALFETAPSLGDSTGNLVFTGTDDDPETLQTLADLGFREPSRVAAAVRRWHHGRYRAVRSERAREKLTSLMPMLMEQFGATADPDAALLRFDEFLGKLPAGIQLFSLFYANPWLLELVARIMGTAPNLAETLSRNANLLDGVLGADFYEPLPDRAALRADLTAVLGQKQDYQDVLEITRRWAADRQFQVGLQVLDKPSETASASAALSRIAETAVSCLLPHVSHEFSLTHGNVDGGDMAVIALGKLGAGEMTFGSDLDLIFVYDHAANVQASDGPKPLSPALYYARLCQRVIGAITALTAEGRLYDVDMRLRPSGNAGPIAVALQGFRDYHRENAWTWEHMALSRARVITGSTDLADAIEATIKDALTARRDAEQLRKDVADMYRRVRQEHGTDDPWSIKYAEGGLMEAEFLGQYLLLRHAHAHPEILAGQAIKVFEKAGAEGLIDPATGTRLVRAIGMLNAVQGLLRLCTVGAYEPGATSTDLNVALAAAAGADDFDSAQAALIAAETAVHDAFVSLVSDPQSDA